MVYLDPFAANDTAIQRNARIGGLRKSIKEKKTAIADCCVAGYRNATPPDLSPGGEISLWCREILSAEEQIRALLAELEEYQYQEAAPVRPAEPPRRSPPPEPPSWAAPVFRAPEPERPIPAPPAPQFAAPTVPVPKPAVSAPAPELPTYTPAAPSPARRAPGSASGMLACPVCGVKNPPDMRFCQECGERLEHSSAAPPPPPEKSPPNVRAATVFYCPVCGEVGAANDKFCGSCGARI